MGYMKNLVLLLPGNRKKIWSLFDSWLWVMQVIPSWAALMASASAYITVTDPLVALRITGIPNGNVARLAFLIVTHAC